MKTIEVAITAKDNISRPLDGVAGKLQRLRTTVEGSRGGLNKLSDSFKDFAKEASGATGASGNLVESLMQFAGGGPVALGVAAGIGLIIKLYTDAKAATLELNAAQNNLAVTMAGTVSQFSGTSKALDVATTEYDKAVNKKLEADKKLAMATAIARPTRPGALGGLPAVAGAAAGVFLSTEAKKAQAGALAAEDALVKAQSAMNASAAATYKSLIALQKIRPLNTQQTAELSKVQHLLTAAQKSGNAELALTAIETLKVEDATKKLVDTKKTSAIAEIDVLAKGNSLRLLSLDQIVRYNTLIEQQKLIVKSNTASIEDRINAQERLNTEDRQTQELAAELDARLKSQTNDYNTQTEALAKLVTLGVSGTDIQDKLNAAIVRQQAILATVVPLTAEYADELQRLNTLQEASKSLLSSGGGSIGYYQALAENILNVIQLRQLEISEMSKQKELESNMMNLTLVTNLASDSFQLFFESLAGGGKYISDLGRGFAGLIAGIARQKLAFNIAEGTEALARSFGWISLGNFASAAAAKVAAVGHFKAAALWGAVAGGAGSASRVGGGSAGGGTQSNFGSTETEKIGDVTVIFPDGLIDLRNPATQRQFTKLINEVAGNRQVNFSGA